MITRKLQLGLALFALPACALAFDTVDSIVYPNTGTFPAYPVDEARGPLNFFVQGGVMRDNNVARLSSLANTQAVLGSSQRSDTITRLGVGVRYDQRVIGRQRVRLEARGDQYWYDRYSTFDNFAYGLLGEWDWEVGNQLSGTLGYQRRRALVDLGEIQGLTKDTITEDRYYGTGGYQFAPNWRVRGGLTRSQLHRNSDSVSGHTSGATGGIDYFTPLGNSLGVEVSRTTGDFSAPQVTSDVGNLALPVAVSNQFNEYNYSLVGNFTFGPQWRIGGRVGETRREHTILGQRDFKGSTGRVTVDWLPGTKTILSFAAYKEARPIVDLAASYAVVRGVQFGPSWAATAKLVFNARLITERRSFAGDPAVPLLGLPQRDETIKGVRLGVGWEPIRHTEISLGLDHGTRSSNVLFRDYSYTAVMANLRHNF
jgi:exopolysaccharide biosynthesis operon protein EpsL